MYEGIIDHFAEKSRAFMTVNYELLINGLSQERLNTYSNNQTLGQKETIQAYKYNVLLSAEVFKAISVLEVALRNSISQAWNAKLNCSDWPMNKKEIDPTSNKNTDLIKSIDEAIKDAGQPPKNPKVIANLSFGKWLQFLQPRFAKINNSILEKVFPNYKIDYKKLRSQQVQDIYRQFEVIKILRNRVAHHEPIFKDKNLKDKFESIFECLSWINSEMHILIDRSEFDRLLKEGPASVVVNGF